ncbi:Radical SAM protein [Kitasatospora sp. MMS16-BH015]|uniref:radical SAM/SPASM domain-containing protein n=1 Tax=Kitasatospora sp. MMS16-BH015 TaxID=2018025 RepID=UPI000CA27455|nr:radical SAM protein [Kitasatospora sp. MMS16-BH015]AUG81969.1 Radical SAM protein [Kitasatospora sp. MMS16-BH015]
MDQPLAAATARELFRLSAPASPDLHLLRTEVGHHLLTVNGSRVFDVDEPTYRALDDARHGVDPTVLTRLLDGLGLGTPPLIDDTPLPPPPVRALSLSVAQKCNLGCTYCYAQQGNFGGPDKSMPADAALAAVDLLFRSAAPGERVNLSFLGGEPLINRQVIRTATERAVRLSADTGVPVTFSLTTNGTLVTPEDSEFFEQHAFAVTVSLDGGPAQHDLLRPYRGGRGSYETVLAKVQPLLAAQRRMQVSARVTVTPRNLRLRETLDAFVGLGFHSVGFSPLLNSPTGREELSLPELEVMLGEMTACGEEFERQVVAGRRYPFANLVNALREIHQGTHRPYPCGAGAGYLGVSADGELAACHRFVGDREGAMGDLARGVDPKRQLAWLSERHVHRQSPCQGCWARYLCGGGCHHEVISRGRPACDYIRGWLHYSLGAYSRLLARRPDWFSPVPAARVER